MSLSLLLAALFAATLTNPLLPSGPDPWVVVHHGSYFYMNTTGKNLTIWKTRSIGKLDSAEKKVVWTPPASGPYSHGIWAPELHSSTASGTSIFPPMPQRIKRIASGCSRIVLMIRFKAPGR